MKLMKLVASTATAVCVATASFAADFSFTGTFVDDDDVQFFNFTVGATSTVTLRSYSYAGGTMADGTVISAGGFDPILALWDSSGNRINEWDDGPGSVPADPTTHRHYDTNLVISSLAAGSYTASIAQYANFAAGTNLSAGFTETGNTTFTSDYGCSNGIFCDASGANRASFWAFDVLGVESADAPDNGNVVPLPAAAWLLLGGLGAFGVAGRRRKA